MTSLRRFTCDDLFTFNNVNLDILTETYNLPFYLQVCDLMCVCVLVWCGAVCARAAAVHALCAALRCAALLRCLCGAACCATH